MNLKRSEASVKSSVQQLLKARGCLCFRMNAGDQIIVQGKSRRRIMGNPSGTADLLLFVNCVGVCRTKESAGEWCGQHSHVVWCECKSSTGKQSREQKQFEEMVRAEGHEYLLIRSADQLNEWLNGNT